MRLFLFCLNGSRLESRKEPVPDSSTSSSFLIRREKPLLGLKLSQFFFQTFSSWNDTPPTHDELVASQEPLALDLLSLQRSEFLIREWVTPLASQLILALGSNEHQSFMFALGSRVQLLFYDMPSNLYLSLIGY
jgi:hypothetical protein